MDRRKEAEEATALTQRAVELGEKGCVKDVPELIALAVHPRPYVRRVAASALGKLAEVADVRAAVPRLMDLTRDPHPQVRQYAIIALGKIGDESALPSLRDVANRPGEPEYNIRSALRAIELIEAAARTRQFAGPWVCSRCGKETTAAERRLSQSQFQRIYCDACFNAVFIERRNFEAKVQNQKTILTQDRTVVQSKGERLIADWLTEHDIVFRYDDKFQIICGFAIRPDFYLPELDLFIEYWGMDTTDYKIGMLHKQKLYQQEGKRLLSVFPEKLSSLDRYLIHKLAAHGYHPNPGRDEPSESSLKRNT